MINGCHDLLHAVALVFLAALTLFLEGCSTECQPGQDCEKKDICRQCCDDDVWLSNPSRDIWPCSPESSSQAPFELKEKKVCHAWCESSSCPKATGSDEKTACVDSSRKYARDTTREKPRLEEKTQLGSMLTDFQKALPDMMKKLGAIKDSQQHKAKTSHSHKKHKKHPKHQTEKVDEDDIEDDVPQDVSDIVVGSVYVVLIAWEGVTEGDEAVVGESFPTSIAVDYNTGPSAGERGFIMPSMFRKHFKKAAAPSRLRGTKKLAAKNDASADAVANKLEELAASLSLQQTEDVVDASDGGDDSSGGDTGSSGGDTESDESLDLWASQQTAELLMDDANSPDDPDASIDEKKETESADTPEPQDQPMAQKEVSTGLANISNNSVSEDAGLEEEM